MPPYKYSREMPPLPSDADRERFWSYVRRGQPNECWPWRTNTPGTFWWRCLDGQKHKSGTARLAFRFVKGDIPLDRIIAHECDNPPCCNPAHLHLQTQQQNILDSAARGLHPYMKSENYRNTRGGGNQLKGEDNIHARLRNTDIIEIRRLRTETNMTLKQIGALYDIRPQKVWAIVHRRMWKSVK